MELFLSSEKELPELKKILLALQVDLFSILKYF